ncbi:MAG: DNA repair protein RecO [Clostridia bacterium]|nr:DNA repair protein RecO [Clostridia bacterium]
MLTPNLGKISCVAKGAKRPKSMLMAGSQLLCFGEYVLRKSNDMYTMQSCDPIEIFYQIRIDIDKLNYAASIIKIISDVTTENQNNYNILKLFLNTLYIISESDKNLDFIISVFKMRLLKILGYSPNINECVSCGEKENLQSFSIKDDGFKCTSCSKQDKSAIKMSEGCRYAIIYSLKADAKKIFSFTIKEESLKEFELITRIYFNEKLEKEYKVEKI